MTPPDLPKSDHDRREAVFCVLATTAGLRNWERDELDSLTDRIVAAFSTSDHQEADRG